MVEECIYQFEEEQKEILLYFYNWLTTEFNLLPKLKFKIPFYYKQSWICYTNPLKNKGVELVFVRGNELSDSCKILKANNRKQAKGIEITSLKNASLNKIHQTIQEAIILDETTPYNSKNKTR